MNKIAQYLNEHILGEVTSAKSVKDRFSRDESFLSITPEIIVHPRITNDIRKVARFTWQLAEKGHIMPITSRGAGTDQTGASIGKGIIINTIAHLNNIIYLNLKNKDQFIHVQPGVTFGTINEVLKSHGLLIPSFPTSFNYSTIGGAVANNAAGPLSGRYGATGNYVMRLEVVLANGDLIETKRINRHELDKKKGLQTFEGELYRKIDGLIEDSQKIIEDKISKSNDDNVGYPGISKVKERDGSFDLTPLFIGSQGTLGIISEIILRPDYGSDIESMLIASFDNAESARDAADLIGSIKPASLDLIDAAIFNKAQDEYGKVFSFSSSTGAILIASFNDYKDRIRSKKIKLSIKKLAKFDTKILTDKDYSLDEMHAIRSVSALTLQPASEHESMPPLIDGASIAPDRREDFVKAMSELAEKHHIELPLHINWVNGVVHTRPTLQLHSVTDKQKAFKLIADYAELVKRFNGSFCVESGEGRLKSNPIYAQMDEDIIAIYKQIRETFDPYNTMNPGVKQVNEMKALITSLNPDYNLADIAQYSPKF